MTEEPRGGSGRVALLGWPVAHSISPAMQNAAFATAGLDWRYELLPVRRGAVGAAIERLAAEGFVGANVTVPHKRAVIDFVDDLAEDARTLGAVNTLVFNSDAEGVRICGYNTDHAGFLAPLLRRGFDLRGRRAVILGAGGAARAAAYALQRAGTAEVTILARREGQAAALSSELAHVGTGVLRMGRIGDRRALKAATNASLLVNATSVGMAPHDDQSPWPVDVSIPSDVLVYDLVYTPAETRLLAHARACGAEGLGGLEMLVAQGARAFTLWTGLEAPIEAMRSAAEKALSGLIEVHNEEDR